METAEAHIQTPTPKATKPTVLFVDDEKRVLNSMRAMFRRDYNLFLTTRGDEALKIIVENNVDVVVADQRMPIMTGVEVLSAVKEQSPDTVRILLTGYADLEAIEGAMNDGEVFRFLSKPCAAEELRGTIKLATEIARDTSVGTGSELGDLDDESVLANVAEMGIDNQVADKLNEISVGGNLELIKTAVLPESYGPSADTSVEKPAPVPELPQTPLQSAASIALGEDSSEAVHTATQRLDETAVEIVMSGDLHETIDNSVPEPTPDFSATAVLDEAPVLAPPEEDDSHADTSSRINVVGTGKYKVSVIVFSDDEQFAKSVGRSLQDYFYTFHASNVAHLMHGIQKVAPAVLITDISEDPDVIQQLTSNLKQKVPEMVTMVASQYRDADLMVKLINHGQVFRFVDKPLSSTACKRHVREAIKKHIQLRDNPDLIQRHQVVANNEASKLPASIGKLFSRIGRVRKLWGRKPH